VKKGAWGTRLGFYLAAIGSAFGLGNLWRFPYVVAENGGGAFVLLYLLSVLIIGLPFLIGELVFGKFLANARPESVRIPHIYIRTMNWVTSGLCIVVLSYYAVISGWVLHFLMQLIIPLFTDGAIRPEESLQVLMQNGWLQVALTSVHLLICTVIVGQDVEQGLEKWVGYMMPAFAILLLGLAYKSVNLESASEALRFLLYPDFSKLTLSSLGQAIGHTFFTLSVGLGTMITFGSYMSEKTYVPSAGFRVANMDSVISIFAGVLIFPLMLMMTTKVVSSPDLMFQTVPLLFARIPGGHLFGVGFFLCLYLAALAASIGLLESIVNNYRKRFNKPRLNSTIRMSLLCFLLAIVPALSSSVLGNVKVGDHGVLEILDSILINWVLPIVALTISVLVFRAMDLESIKKEFIDENKKGTNVLFRHWLFVARYLGPGLIILALLLQLASLI